jgi:hypothetical protein
MDEPARHRKPDIQFHPVTAYDLERLALPVSRKFFLTFGAPLETGLSVPPRPDPEPGANRTFYLDPASREK